ncbi:MAG: amidohydrolase family protein, partial [Acidobacteriota bacterium]
IFMTSPTFADREGEYASVIRAAGQAGLLTFLHCEDGVVLAEAVQKLTAAGHTSLRYYSESRPVDAELRAVERAVALCEKTGAPIYIVHLSSGKALAACRAARDRGLPVSVETRPLYLYFTRERYLQADGPLYVGQPPLREQSDVEALWQGMAGGWVDVLGSDHAPWTREQKMDAGLNIAKLRPGVADLQTMLPVLYSEGVSKGRISLQRFVALIASRAARLLGLYPRKGAIAVGSDADLALWDLGAVRKLTADVLHSRAGFSLHEGWEIRGWPVMTIRRGEVVCEQGRIRAAPGTGRVLTRAAAQAR